MIKDMKKQFFSFIIAIFAVKLNVNIETILNYGDRRKINSQ